MHQKNAQKPKSKKHNKRKWFFIFIFALGTLFLLSFSTTSYILINSYRLTFVKDNYAQLQQQLGLLKIELSRKESQIEELKLQLATIEGESSFVSQSLNGEN